MSNILDKILARKAEEVAESKNRRPLTEVKAAMADAPAPRSLRRSLEQTPGGVISEFKRRSPSKDWIKRDARPEDIIPTYEAAGAAALSILTDHDFFGGSLADVVAARPLTSLPILRKEFIIDPYQIYEARAAGADAILLIAAAIGAARCHELAAVAKDAGLEVLLEIHSAEELEAYSPNVDVLGVNNRDLKVFRTDPEQSIRLFDQLPAEPLPISESGLLDPAVARRVLSAGYRGILVGEAFMKHDVPGDALKAYLNCLLNPADEA